MFSIIIPLYNKAKTIRNTLQTVLQQTLADFEVIIVDDGSTDNGVEVIEHFTNDKRVRIIRQKNQGVSVARNNGILYAKNRWVAFLDADDEWLPEYLGSVYRASIAFPEAGMILTGRFSQDVQTGVRVNSIPEAYQNRDTLIEFFHNPHVFAHISATTVERTLLVENVNSWGSFMPGQKSNEDFVFLFRVALHTKVAFCGYSLAIYNGGVEGQATSVMNEKVKLDDSILFHNLVVEEWRSTSKSNKAFSIFMRYEVRHIFYLYLKAGKLGTIKNFISGMNPDNLYSLFKRMEIAMYEMPGLSQLMIVYIGLTKIVWRLRGYPRVK
jgi:glycosyltransferase involved in cell wall biosynthesis